MLLLQVDGGGEKGFDHCFVIDGEFGTLRQAARVVDVSSNREMEVLMHLQSSNNFFFTKYFAHIVNRFGPISLAFNYTQGIFWMVKV